METKRFVADFIIDREKWRKEEELVQKIENQKIAEFATKQRVREEELAAQKQMVAAGKNAIYDKLASQQNKAELAKMELEELRIDLAQEEQQAASRGKEQELLRARVQKRLDLVEAYQAQVAYKAKSIEEAAREENVYRANVTIQLILVDEKVCGRRPC